MAYYLWWWQRTPEVGVSSSADAIQLSVVVAARNEAHHISKLLIALTNQQYPKGLFEVVVVDDHSTDDTAAMVQASAQPNVKLIRADAQQSGKKAALTQGIGAAKYTNLVITDADCVPQPQWLSYMADAFAAGASFIAAPVKYNSNGTVLHIFQTLDFITLQGITAAGVSSGLHSLCNGANLGYTKDAFQQVHGFAGVDHVASGDDVLLMHKIKTAGGKVVYLKNKDAIVVTDPAPTWRSFIQQRMRWGSKTTAYQDRSLFWALLLVFVLNAFLLTLCIAGFFNFEFFILTFAFLIWKTAAELPFVYSVAKFFNQQKLVLWFPLLQPLHVLYTVVVGLLSQTGSYHWKGRSTK